MSSNREWRQLKLNGSRPITAASSNPAIVRMLLQAAEGLALRFEMGVYRQGLEDIIFDNALVGFLGECGSVLLLGYVEGEVGWLQIQSSAGLWMVFRIVPVSLRIAYGTIHGSIAEAEATIDDLVRWWQVADPQQRRRALRSDFRIVQIARAALDQYRR